MEDNNLMFNNILWKVNSKITKQTLNRTQQQEGQQLRVIQQPVPNQQQNQQQLQCKQQKDVKEDEEKKKKTHEVDGLMIKVNVSLIYGVKNKVC